MKGYLLEIKNNLLEEKHYRNMGVAVWLYMWLLDHVTSVNEEGIGKVEYGKPLTYSDIDLGISDRTYREWLDTLEKYGYINKKRAPYGLLITVNKTHKYFGKKSDRQDSAYPDRQNSSRDRQDSADVIITKTYTKTSGGIPEKYKKAKNTVSKNIQILKKEFPHVEDMGYEIIKWSEKAAQDKWDVGEKSHSHMKSFRQWCNNIKVEYQRVRKPRTPVVDV